MNLFRYISFEKLSFIKDVIEDNTLYFAFPKEFRNNDAYDCRTYDITFNREIDCNQSIWDEINAKHPDQDMYERYKQYQLNVRAHPWFDNKFFMERINAFNRIIKDGLDESRLGILCLTPNYDNRRMWQDYCKSFDGVCISLNVDTIIQTLMSSEISSWHGDNNLNYLYRVNYVENSIKIPYLEYKNFDPYMLGIKKIYTKFKKFDYEEERRFIIPECINQKVRFPSDLINAVIIGIRASMTNRAYIESVWGRRGQDFTIVNQSLEP